VKRGSTGQYENTATGDEAVRAFVPVPLPPDPLLDLSGVRQRSLERALLACGRLDGVTALLPDPDLFFYAYVRREAVLSSQIEGTLASRSVSCRLLTRWTRKANPFLMVCSTLPSTRNAPSSCRTWPYLS
jgi:hypothetical protein